MRTLLLSLLAVFSFSAYAETPAEAPAADPFVLNTNAFLDQGALPVMYTCDGKDASPELDWKGAPAKTEAYALVMKDLDAPGGEFYHWVVYNIPKATAALDEGTDKMPAGATIMKNSWGKAAYNGPCPPKGMAHTYNFTLYALDGKLSLPADADPKAVLDAMEKHQVGKATLTTVYSRWVR